MGSVMNKASFLHKFEATLTDLSHWEKCRMRALHVVAGLTQMEYLLRVQHA